MKSKAYLPVLAVTLLAVGCGGLRLEMGTVGDFCDVARPLPYASDAVADFMAEHDPAHVGRDSAHNIYGERNCDWNWNL